MIKFISILVSILLSIPTMACEKPVQSLSIGDISPCSGYLFSPKKEQEIRLKVAQFDLLKKYSNTQSGINNILDKRLTNAQEYNKYLSKRLKEEKDTNFWQTALYFSLGVVVTGVIASNVGK